MSTTGPSTACPASARDGFWKNKFSSSGPLFRLGLLLHVGTQHRIDAALIAVALALEIVEHVFIDADGDRLFLRRNHQNGVRPVDIFELRPIGIIRDRGFDFPLRHCVETRPVSLSLTPVAPPT